MDVAVKNRVAISDGEIGIDTYLFDKEDRFPDIFMKGRRRAMVYPYARLNNLTQTMRPRRYRAVFIENEFLKVTMLPDLGGHLYAAHDKINNREVFYRTTCIKPSGLGQRGAWCPMGIEFNFPTSHSATTLSPVHYAMRENPDGSASCVIGDVDRMTRMQWSLELTLRPGCSWVEAHVTLHNRTEVPHWYYWWSNAAIHVDDGTKYVYPVIYTHGHGATFGRNHWPLIRGVDYSWHKNVRSTFGMFGRGSREDFMGAYDVVNDWGVVHVADYRVLPGKKLFDWGVTRAGRKWVREFSLKDGGYAEIQAGLFENQPQAGPIAPHGVVRFREVWWPLHGMGVPFARANDDAAVALERRDDGTLHLGVNVSCARPDARVVLKIKGKQVFSRTQDLAPDAPLSTDVKPAVKAFEDADCELSVFDGDGRELLTYRPRPAAGKGQEEGWLDPKSHAEEGGDDSNGTPERIYQQGLRWESFRLRWRARQLYEQALQLDDGFAPARLRLGMLCVKSGQWTEAIRHLNRALARDPLLVDAYYFLGLAHAGLGEDGPARDAFWYPLRLDPEDVRCLHELALVALREEDYAEAVEFLRRAMRISPDDSRSAAMLGLALRCAGEPQEALEIVAPMVTRYPADWLLRCESERALAVLGRKAEAKAEAAELSRLIDRTVQSWIELALDYRRAGRLEDAADVFARALDEAGPRGRVDPMLCYHAAYTLEQLGRTKDAAKLYARGAKQSPERCFPSRVEAFDVLRRVLERNPDDARARLYLGTLLYARERRAEAVEQWRKAARTITDSVVLYRDLAYAAWEREELKRAAHWQRRALKLEPDNEQLLMPLVYILLEDRRWDAALKLLRRGLRQNPESDAVREYYAGMLIDRGQPEEAVKLLANHNFNSRHGVFSLTRLHLNSHVAIGERLMAKGDIEGAHKEFDVARHIPVQLGEDELFAKFFGKAHYLAGLCLEQLGREREAKTCLKECVNENDRGLPELHYWRALAWRKLGNDKSAEAELKKLASTIDRLEQRKRFRADYLHYLKSLHLAGTGRRKEAEREKDLAHEKGWRDSMEHDFSYKFGFS